MLHIRDMALPVRIASSALADDGAITTAGDFHQWFSQCVEKDESQVTRIPFSELSGWRFEEQTGNLVHHTGKFFSVRGLQVRTENRPVTEWSQPIINQPEIGILGILVKEFDGILHCLMQSKMEPGNCNRVQLSPTVQATRSNYTGVHRGSAVPYLDYFLDAEPRHVLADVLQSEQGSWFYRKRNRNIIVEATGDVEVLDGFCWLSVGQLHDLLTVDDLINMDARTVLSCLPFSGVGLCAIFPFDAEPLRSGLIRSISEDQGTLHTSSQIRSWITDSRVREDVETKLVDLTGVEGWHRSEDRISHETGTFFDVMAVDVQAGNREVLSWTQPMIESRNLGVVAFLIKRIRGVVHALVNARVEPGYLDVVELAPTVQCTPENYTHLPPEARPPLLDEVLSAPPDLIHFDTVLSEEGGRFFHTRNRYVIVEVPPDRDIEAPNDFRWMTLHQLAGLMQHSHYVNIQARSLITCLHSLLREPKRAAG
ncbi:oxidase EvaA [Kibdelosporangium banguiense]|uniref:Oxidase EvaA n=1 Tax=Kibdelosporangium banguiense TaxID=1365924 RepID=A0ABS4TXQ1_9PSEU|nr:NDP-hexose 2,3-dehydratase family protein [Kibdelosporangium banguiense]MBP2329151.1 oxidase EvaA [Kibdelosporangium banguiense]